MILKCGFVVLLLLTSLMAGAAPHPEPYLNKQEVRHIVDNTIDALTQTYLFPDRTQKAIDRLRLEASRGEFTRGYHFGQFRQKFESILVNSTSDTGFELVEKRSVNSLAALPADAEDSAIETEILTDNVGYLKLSGDFLKTDRRADLTQALDYLQTNDALIVDLREAGDASMEFVHHLTSFFLPAGTHMATVSFNAQHAPVALYAEEKAGFSTYRDGLPVFILTSGFVSGPWEFVSYTLKHFEAAVIVGEDTMGVSYMMKTLSVSEHAELTLYYAQITHPVTQENWQQTGVFADYQVSAAESEKVALSLATGRQP